MMNQMETSWILLGKYALFSLEYEVRSLENRFRSELRSSAGRFIVMNRGHRRSLSYKVENRRAK